MLGHPGLLPPLLDWPSHELVLAEIEGDKAMNKQTTKVKLELGLQL